MEGSRYTRGAPPLVGMRIATPAVRAAPPAALLTACLAGGCDGGAAGGPGPQPQNAQQGTGEKGSRGRKNPRPSTIENTGAPRTGLVTRRSKAGARPSPSHGAR